jgi:dipeptidyl-peptidase 4
MTGGSAAVAANRCRAFALAAACALFVPAALAAPADPAGRAAPTLERIVSLPKLDGTTPARPAWSPDSRQVAFLWNDHGMPFRDLWVADVADAAPRRLTRHAPEPASVLGPGPDHSLAALAERAARRQDTGLSDLLWHPDGRSLFYVYRGELRQLSTDDGTERLRSRGGAARLGVSPDGRRLSFLRGGDLWLMELAGGEARPATQVGRPGIGTVAIGAYLAPDVYVGRYAWAPGSQQLALEIVDQREVRRVPFPSYLHDEPLLHEVRRPAPGDTGPARRMAILDLPGNALSYLDLEAPDRRLVLEFSWSPSGDALLVMQGADVAEDRWLFVVSADGHAIRQLWHDHRPRRVYPLFRALWSADGEQVLFVGDHEQWYRLYSVPRGGGDARTLTGPFDVAGDRSGAWIDVDPASGDVLFVAAASSPYERHVYRMTAEGGELRRVTALAGVHQPTLSPDGRHLASIASNDTTPAELYLRTASGNGDERRVTRSPLAEFYEYQWLAPRYASFPSRIDGFSVHARIVEPPARDPGKRYPVIFGSIYSNTVLNLWNPDRPTSLLQQQMAMSGDYITVLVDVRGSVGYGVEFREAFQGDWGRGDLEDLHAAVDYLAGLDHVDPERIGIWGNSYGGLLVLSALFRKPGLFAAGVAGAPAVDVWHFTGFDQHLTRRPDTHPGIFAEGSLLDLGERLADPLLIIHGLHDDIVPLKTTLMMTEKLALLNKNFELHIVHDSGHWWAASEHYARNTFARLNEFLRRHVPAGPR